MEKARKSFRRSNRIASMSTSGVCIVLDWIVALREELVSLAYTAALPASHTVMMFGDCLYGGVWWANPIV